VPIDELSCPVLPGATIGHTVGQRFAGGGVEAGSVALACHGPKLITDELLDQNWVQKKPEKARNAGVPRSTKMGNIS
jgi:hypothetical protein